MSAKRKKKPMTKVATILMMVLLLLGALAYVARPILMSAQKNAHPNVENHVAPSRGDVDASTTTQEGAASLSLSNQIAPEVISIEHLEYPRMTVSRREQVIEHIGYTVSYNADFNLPNWVAYELTEEETEGVEERSDHFRPDPLVEGDPVVTKDYANSGYDRGHMAPAADMKWSAEAMKESFYMTNMCPQLHNLNAGDWKTLEEAVRSWAKEFDKVYIACGPIVDEEPKTIGTERLIVVPAAFYKVILSEKDGNWYTIGFVMNNVAGHKKLSTYAMPVDEIEQLTGLDFFYNLPDSIEDQVESAFSLSMWGVQ